MEPGHTLVKALADPARLNAFARIVLAAHSDDPLQPRRDMVDERFPERIAGGRGRRRREAPPTREPSHASHRQTARSGHSA